MQDRHRVVLQDKPSAAEILVYWAITGGMLTGLLLALAYISTAITLLQNLFLLLAFAAIILSSIRLLIDFVERELSLYVLTQDTLTTRRGFNQRINSIPLEHVQQVLVRKPLVGQILDYGTLTVKAPGWSFGRIDRVPHPDKWQQAILDLRHVH